MDYCSHTGFYWLVDIVARNEDDSGDDQSDTEFEAESDTESDVTELFIYSHDD